MLSSFTTTYRRPQQLQEMRGNTAEYFNTTKEQPKLTGTVGDPIRAATSNTHLHNLEADSESLTTPQQDQVKQDLELVFEQLLSPRKTARFSFLDTSQWDEQMNHKIRLPSGGSFHEKRLYSAAYEENDYKEASLLNEKLEQSREIVCQSSLNSINTVKDTWLSLARSYLLHPNSEKAILSTNAIARNGCHVVSDVYGQRRHYFEHVSQHTSLIAKSIEICRTGALSLQRLKDGSATSKSQNTLDEAIADLKMQEAQGCYAYQEIESCLVNRVSHSALALRCAAAGELYSSLIDKVDSADLPRIREKLANSLVLMACNGYERELDQPISVDEISWRAKNPQSDVEYNIEAKGPRERAMKITLESSWDYRPQFSEHCFREAAYHLKCITSQTDLQPKDWLRLNCKYASALVKQGLGMPFIHPRNNELRPIIDKTIRSIKQYFLKNKDVLSKQEQVRSMTQISDLVYAEAKQRPYRDPSFCWPKKKARQILKQKQATILANRAYRLMEKNGGAEAMPFEAHFLERRSSLSPFYESKYQKRPYNSTATALHSFEQQWSPKVHLLNAEDIVRRATMQT